MNNGILFSISDFWRLPDMLHDGVSETAGMVLEVIIVDLAGTNRTFNKGVFLVNGLEEFEMAVQDRGVILQHNDV